MCDAEAVLSRYLTRNTPAPSTIACRQLIFIPAVVLYPTNTQKFFNLRLWFPFKVYGPPRIRNVLMCKEEFQSKKLHMECRYENVYISNNDKIMDEMKFREKKVLNDVSEENSPEDSASPFVCVSGEEKFSMDSENILHEISIIANRYIYEGRF